MPRQRRPIAKDDAHPVSILLDAVHLAAADLDARSTEVPPLLRRERRAGAREQDDVGAQRGQEQRLVDRPLARGVDGQRTVSHLPAVAVRAVEHPRPPQARRAVEIREAVAHAVREHQPAAGDEAPVRKVELEAGAGKSAGRSGRRGAELDGRIRTELLAAEPAELAGWSAVLGEEPVDTPRHRVCRRVGIEEEHPPPHPSQDEGRIQSRRARAHHPGWAGAWLSGGRPPRRIRPRTRAAFSPAGPAPTMSTSNGRWIIAPPFLLTAYVYTVR